MAIQVTNNSSTFQPLIDFTSWCKAETSNLVNPLPANDQWSDVAKRIVILFSILLPIYGIIAMIISPCCAETARNPARATQPTATPQSRQQVNNPVAEANAGRAEALRDAARGQVAIRPMTPDELQLSEGILGSLENLGVDRDELTNYLELRARVQKIDSARLQKHKALYDRVVLKINELDQQANFNLESNLQPTLAAFAPNPDPVRNTQRADTAALPAVTGIAEKIREVLAAIEPQFFMTISEDLTIAAQFDLNLYNTEKAKFNQINPKDVSVALKTEYDQVAGFIQQIDAYIVEKNL